MIRPRLPALLATCLLCAALAAEMQRLDDPAELTVASPRPAAWSPPPARGKK